MSQKKLVSCVGLILFGLCGVGRARPTPPASAGRVVVGPNYLVSRDGDVPHAETMIAANPTDVRNLVGGAITLFTRPIGGWAVRSYATRDGGATWRWNDFPEQVEHGGGDPQVVFTRDGAAVFVALAFRGLEDDQGRPRGTMQVYRSQDGGFTWTRTQNICCSHDHPQMVVDRSSGRFADRIYIATLSGGGYPEYEVSVLRSDDGGRNFSPPVVAARGGGVKGLNVFTPVVLSDGTLYVPYLDFEFRPEKVKEQTERGLAFFNVWYVTSSDGGLTFSKPRQTPQVLEIDLKQPNMSEGVAMPFTAADTSNGKYRDRLYRVWAAFRAGKPRVFFTRSTDRGATWGSPVTLPADAPAASRQFQPTVAVNKDGTVGVTWFDTRDSTDGTQCHLYFAASLDGGESFLPPTRVSSAPSTPGGRGNSVPAASTYSSGENMVMSFESAASRWPTGGDYLGMTADRRGVFYPLWTDARSGTFQLYTAPIRVDLPPPPPPDDPEKAKYEASRALPSEPKSDAAKRLVKTLHGKVELVFDPPVYDAGAGTTEIPVRLKNTSSGSIYPPITLEIVRLDDGWEATEVKNPPQILNAQDGGTGIGARFSFDEALGGDGELKPGMLSASVPLRFRLVFEPLGGPAVQFKLTGSVDTE